jgi:CubicO group peptidase (beta-lactamase class C family)
VSTIKLKNWRINAIFVAILVVFSPFWACQSTEITIAPESISTRSLAQIDSVINQAINQQIFPGAVVHVIQNDSTLFHKAFGYFDYDQTTQMDTSSVFDVASITKVMGTTLAFMGLHDQGDINIYDPVAKFLPEFNTPDKRTITIYQLLTHTSGLPAFRIYIDKLKTRDELIHAIKNEPLVQNPGESYLYSDLGLILCGIIIEQLSGQRQDEYMAENWFSRLKLHDTTFNPKTRGDSFVARILPTEIDTMYRHKLIQGEVHDERAWYMDGVAGHAGLFSTSTDIGRFARMLLNHGKLDQFQYLSESVVRNFTRRQAPLLRRGIGFDMKSIDGFSSAGTLASGRTFGHTGFTGTSFWVDPERNLVVIILTNRTFPYRGTSTGISRVRSDVADIVHQYISN